MGEPSLLVSAIPRTVTDATPIKVTVTATRGDGSIGAGTVKVSTSAGSLTAGEDLTLDEYGRAITTFICDPNTEALCSPTVRVVAEWNAGKEGVVTGESRVTATRPPPVVIDPEESTDGGFSSAKAYVMSRLGTTGCNLVISDFRDIALKKTKFGITARVPAIPPILSGCGTIFGRYDTSDVRNGEASPFMTSAPHSIHPDGRLLYIDPMGALRAWAEDPLEIVGGVARYPTNPVANDPLVPTPGCPVVQEFLIRPTGEIGYSCSATVMAPGVWLQNGAPLAVLPPGFNYAALGPGQSALIAEIPNRYGKFRTRDMAGVEHEIPETLFKGLLHRPARWVDDHWLIVDYYAGQFEPMQLMRVNLDGSISVEGQYQLPPMMANVASGALARDGTLYLRGTRSIGTNLVGALVRFPKGSAPTIVYTQDMPPVEDWSVMPPLIEVPLPSAFVFSGP